MISNARGKHSSPGVYIEEIDKTYATKSLGITTLGVVGETLKGPAFEPIQISDWSEFQDYFGGTSTEKYIGTGYPKYELPYIAKSYLQESKNLEVCRVLGFSGYKAGDAWVVYGNKVNVEEGQTSKKYPIAILRSKASYTINQDAKVNCTGESTYDDLKFIVSNCTIGPYSSIESSFSQCEMIVSGSVVDKTVDTNGNYGSFKLIITKTDGQIENVVVSLNPNEKNYIVNVLGMNPHKGDYSLFVEEMYDLAHIKSCDEGLYDSLNVEKVSADIVGNYLQQFRSATTPWFVSEVKGNGENADIKKLFRFHTISDGNSANSQIKISIENLLPDEGLFDVVIRDYNDTDNSIVILEKYTKCNMVPGTANYIGLKIGTLNGDYANKSKYVTVEVIENEVTETCIPCGFLGYPLRKMEGFEIPELNYNRTYIEYIKSNRQYFGMSDMSGVDLDILSYKGFGAYKTLQLPQEGYSKGFHLDALVNHENINITVDGVSGYSFVTVDKEAGVESGASTMPRIGSEDLMNTTIYQDKRLRKFTCYPYGGFDGWDIYRTERTNTNEYRQNRYKGSLNTLDGEGNLNTNFSFTSVFESGLYGLSGKVNSSDYYAYLAGYKQFDNPSKIKINLLATPGIDYVHNLDLVNEVLDIIEEYRQGDCLYIVTTPDNENGQEIDAYSAVSNLEMQEISSSYIATYYPWVKYYDSTNKKYINLPATKDVVRNFAYTDNVSHPWFASAGMSRGNVECVKATHFTRLEEEDVLYEGMINPIKSFGSDGVKIWGNKTMYQEDTPLNRINVRRLMIRIKDLVMSAAKQLVFEQNDNTVDSQFRSIVDPILANAKQNRGISDYKIKTDTSAEARDRKELPAAIYVKPINCLEYVDITFTIFPEGAKFDE